ncbi:ABC transporter substrate-binding protein [Actinoalloteichus hymeniacidonis]|uniref:ABC-type nitrate/sulfonate/bicarbonate transport system, periplasmic component n=1 Tax=Actinoalloteichus hymeniacidonis TaxID=340345 RepID=A0AAC9MXM6_9PSEU|nr:ABC transporter substrate-binding protein [Actinoalloteichus hymeniacidonis]AOS63418.1 ABC-type nitrate/sulfonate/bicarbonate transport system, periplasmic component [Actinoalloteichus hymeniacidonis]MBB5908540.1 NitT/TauT family transport system substrate-binding protein [Actinoalloteichus hymeniacidonis]
MKVSRVVVGATVMALAAGCGGTGGETTTNADGVELDVVTLTLNWYPYGEHAPFYHGLEQGVFEEHGIDLRIQAGQGSQKTVQATTSGQTDFGWADTPAVLAGVAQGLDVTSVGVFLQTTPSSAQFFSDKEIESPDDLRGMTIASTAGDALSATFPAFLEINGIEADEVELQNTDPAGKMAAVISGQTDALLGFATDQGPTMQESADRDVSYLRFADHGLNFFSNGLITASDNLTEREDLVRRMVTASSQAWAQAAEADPAEVVGAMSDAGEQLPSPEVLTEQFEATLELLHTEATEGMPPGVNTEEDWTTTIEIFAEAGVIETAEEPAAYWDASFAPEG